MDSPKKHPAQQPWDGVWGPDILHHRLLPAFFLRGLRSRRSSFVYRQVILHGRIDGGGIFTSAQTDLPRAGGRLLSHEDVDR